MLRILFPDVGELKIWESKPTLKYIGIFGSLFFFEGETAFDAMNLQMTLTETIDEAYTGVFEYKVGLGPIGGDGSKGFYMEQIRDKSAKPYYLSEEFVPLVSGIPVKFYNINTALGVGIWIERKYNPTKLAALFNEESTFWDTNTHMPVVDFDLELNFETEEFVV